jgi:hypothetical protein
MKTRSAVAPSSLRLALGLAVALGAATPSLAHAESVTPADATPVQREQAQGRFARGKALHGEGKFQEALAEFEASLDIVASPNTRLYVARCHRAMDNFVRAYVELGRTAVEASELARDDPRYAQTAESALEERKELEPKLGFVDVAITRASSETRLVVSGDEVRRGGWDEPVPVMPGTAEIVVQTPGLLPITRSLSVAAGEKHSVEIDAASAEPEAVAVPDEAPPVPVEEPSPGPLRPLAYAAGGLAIAGFATFAIAGAMANGTHSDLERACGAGPCPPGHEDDISAGRTQQTIANVGLGVGILGAAAAVTLFLVSKPTPAPATGATARSGRSGSEGFGVRTQILAGPSFVGLRGAF